MLFRAVPEPFALLVDQGGLIPVATPDHRDHNQKQDKRTKAEKKFLIHGSKAERTSEVKVQNPCLEHKVVLGP